MIVERKLTGFWYLKKRFFGGYKVMVQITASHKCSNDFSIGPEFKKWEKASAEDLIGIGIKIG